MACPKVGKVGGTITLGCSMTQGWAWWRGTSYREPAQSCLFPRRPCSLASSSAVRELVVVGGVPVGGHGGRGTAVGGVLSVGHRWSPGLGRGLVSSTVGVDGKWLGTNNSVIFLRFG